MQGDLGFAPLLERVLAAYGGLSPGALKLSANVTSVSRPAARDAGPVLLTYTTSGAAAEAAPQTVTCRALLDTAAPTLGGLTYLGDLDAEEAAVFGRVFANEYASIAVKVEPPLPFANYVADPSRGGTPPASLLLRSATAGQPANPILSASDDPVLTGWPQYFTFLEPGKANRPAPKNASAAAPPRPNVGVAYSLSDVPLSASQYSQRAVDTFARGAATVEKPSRSTLLARHRVQPLAQLRKGGGAHQGPVHGDAHLTAPRHGALEARVKISPRLADEHHADAKVLWRGRRVVLEADGVAAQHAAHERPQALEPARLRGVLAHQHDAGHQARGHLAHRPPRKGALQGARVRRVQQHAVARPRVVRRQPVVVRVVEQRGWDVGPCLAARGGVRRAAARAARACWCTGPAAPARPAAAGWGAPARGCRRLRR